MTDKYDNFQQGQKLGHCLQCGWKDGDGVKECYYDSNVGSVTHQNSPQSVRAQMSPSQRSLYDSYNSMKSVYSSEAALQFALRKAIERLEDKINNPRAILAFSDERKIVLAAQLKTTDRILKYGLDPKAPGGVYFLPDQDETTLDAALKEGYVKVREGIGDHVTVQFPHEVCGGVGVFFGPYHIGCSKCAEEIKLWEFGVDYDVG